MTAGGHVAGWASGALAANGAVAGRAQASTGAGVAGPGAPPKLVPQTVSSPGEAPGPLAADGSQAALNKVMGGGSTKKVLRQRKMGLWSRMFKRHLNRNFAEDAEVAARGAFFVVLLSLPLMVKPESFPLAEWIFKNRVYKSQTVLYIVNSLSKTVGETVYLIWCGLAGVIFCLLDVCLMYHLLPEVESDEAHFWIAVANGALFMALILGLNFNINAAIYGSVFFVGYWMSFLKPPSRESITEDAPAAMSAALQELSSCLVGSLFCFLCVMLPYPLLAITQTQDAAVELVSTVSGAWECAISYCCREGGSEFRLRKMATTVRSMGVLLGKMDHLIACSWWECLWSRRRWCSRSLLSDLQKHLTEAYSCVQCVQRYCLAGKFEAQHAQIMSAVVAELREVIGEAGGLLAVCTEVALDGKLSREMKDRVERSRDAVEEANRRLAQSFLAAKKAAGLPGISYELLEEHAFCFGASRLARSSVAYADGILRFFSDNTKKTSSASRMAGGLVWACRRSVGLLCDPATIKSRSQLRFMLRNWVAICSAMTLGYFGLGTVLTPYNAGIAFVSCLLLNKSGGSALQKNIARTQGVVMGTVVGQAAYAALARCDPMNLLLLSSALFLISSLSLFVYFHCDSNAYVGFIMAAFGTLNIVAAPCNDKGFASASTFLDCVLCAVLALGIGWLVDTISAPEEASGLAYGELVKLWSRIEAAVRDMLDPAIEKYTLPGNDIDAHILAAEQLSAEAELEPRLWRPKWRGALFQEALLGASTFCFCLSSIKYGLLAESISDVALTNGAGMGGEVRASARQRVVEKPRSLRLVTLASDFDKLLGMLLDEMRLNKELLRVFVHDAPSELPDLSDENIHLWHRRRAEWERCMEGLVKCQLATWETQNGNGAKPSMEEDFSAQVSLVVVTVNSLMDALGQFRRAALAM